MYSLYSNCIWANTKPVENFPQESANKVWANILCFTVPVMYIGIQEETVPV